jgi:hypothetical protein
VLGHRGLAEVEPLDEIPDRRFGCLEEVKNAPAVRLCENLERGHGQQYA